MRARATRKAFVLRSIRDRQYQRVRFDWAAEPHIYSNIWTASR